MGRAERVKSWWERFNFREFIQYVFPITIWLPKYNVSKLKGDLIAGLTIGLMIIPQSIAFASLSGLPAQNGLYAALFPGVIYALFGTSKDISVGPGVTMALFTAQYNPSFEPLGASMLAFFVGIVLIVMAIFKLGIVANFMPSHVLNGFISAAALTIISTQLRGLFGHEKPPSNFFGKIYHFFANIHKPNVWDLVMSILCLIYLAIFMWLSKKKISKPSNNGSIARKLVTRFIWFFCAARSALVCLLATLVAYLFVSNGYNNSFSLAGKLPKGLPTPQFPLQSYTTSDNETVTVSDSLSGFGSSLIVLPIIQFIQSISITKAFGKMYGYNVDSSQEILALGMSNLVGSFFGGWPVCGGFSRSAVNAMSGAATPLSGTILSLVIVFALSVLTPVFQYIPKPALSAMIVMAVITMIDIHTPMRIWRINKIDFIPYILAFALTFWKLEAGVLGGAFAALVILILKEIKPKLVSTDISEDTVRINFIRTPRYPCVESLKEQLVELTLKSYKNIEVDMTDVTFLDFPVIICLEAAVKEIEKADVTISFINFTNPSVEKSFVVAGLINSEPKAVEETNNRKVIDNNTNHECNADVEMAPILPK